jgi:MCP family monocarboxylic acid transporter-like MFS transporter 10
MDFRAHAVPQVSCGVIFGPTTAIVAQWFLERRALALGLVATGSSIGGVTLPIFFRYMVAHTG